MYKIEPFLPEDIFSLDLVNLDSTTDNYSFTYYLHYHLNHSEQMYAIKTQKLEPNHFIHTNKIIGYIIGKKEKQVVKKNFLQNKDSMSMHISAISIAPSYRLQGLAAQLCNILETQLPDAPFVDLFVRVSNEKAIKFYEKRGYIKYRKIFNYYTSPDEDGWDMRMFITEKKSKGKDIPASFL